jgi:prolyl-tRNA synthetase
MGCFGIGVTRILAAAVETSHDAEGIVWPEAIAPYRACIVSAGSPAQDAHCRRLYAALVARCETMRGELVLDDRPFGDFRFGAKMKDATLVGFPWVIIGGKSVEAAAATAAAEAASAAPSAASSADDTAVRFEVLHRASGERRMMTTAEIVDLFQ